MAELLVEGGEATLRHLRLGSCGVCEEREVEGGDAAAEAAPAGEPAAAGWRETVESGGLRFASVLREDRYGEAQVVVATRGEFSVEVLRVPAQARVRLLPLPGAALAVGVEGPGRFRDLRVASLAAAEARLYVAAGEAALAGGDTAAAVRAARQAAAIAPGSSCHREAGAAAWLEALALQARGAAPPEILAALRVAIEVDPVRYRMQARTSATLAPLRDDPRFVELTRPRPLPGSP